MNVLHYVEKAKRYHLISFDIFDTLLERDVLNPNEIFYRVGQEIFKDDVSAKSFLKNRCVAEKEARKLSKTGEVTLDNIYANLVGYEKQVINDLKECELKHEFLSVRVREDVFHLFSLLIKEEKSVVLISDMYLSKDFILTLLKKCGIIGFKDIFVSCQYGHNKVSGKLFSIVDRIYSINPNCHLHFGDSLKADYIGAYKAGVKAYLFPKNNLFKRMLHKLW